MRNSLTHLNALSMKKILLILVFPGILSTSLLNAQFAISADWSPRQYRPEYLNFYERELGLSTLHLNLEHYYAKNRLGNYITLSSGKKNFTFPMSSELVFVENSSSFYLIDFPSLKFSFRFLEFGVGGLIRIKKYFTMRVGPYFTYNSGNNLINNPGIENYLSIYKLKDLLKRFEYGGQLSASLRIPIYKKLSLYLNTNIGSSSGDMRKNQWKKLFNTYYNPATGDVEVRRIYSTPVKWKHREFGIGLIIEF